MMVALNRFKLVAWMLSLILFLFAEFAWAQSQYQVQAADDWTALFDRDSGWTGSDAAYSIPLSGVEASGLLDNQRSLFVFGDTFIGEVDEDDIRRNSVMIRNTTAILDTIAPDPEQIQFFWNTDPSGDPEELFKADTPNSSAGEWIWPMDGIALNGRIYIYGLKLFDPPGFMNFEVNGVTLISFELDSLDRIINYRHVDTPLFHKDASDNEIIIGQAVLPMTAESGNPDPDGYIYVYGPLNRPLEYKKMIVSRVRPENIEQFEQYEFWDGNAWQSNIENCAALTDSISQEFSVSFLSDGRLVATFQFENDVAVRFAENLLGPFGSVERIYTCPEPDIWSSAFVYNAKAHPHLSEPGKLLIGYNVNTDSWEDLYNIADIYHPRFIHWFYDDPSSISNLPLPDNVVLTLLSNYPNPFNPETTIRYRLSRTSDVFLDIYNALGQRVYKSVQKNLSPGEHQVAWEAGSMAGGVYYYSLTAAGERESGKMLLLK